MWSVKVGCCYLGRLNVGFVAVETRWLVSALLGGWEQPQSQERLHPCMHTHSNSILAFLRGAAQPKFKSDVEGSS